MTDDRSGRKPDAEIPGTELLRVLIGSQAHGTALPDSDRDERMVFIVPTGEFFRIDTRGVAKTVWLENKDSGQDLTGWEVQHFCKLAVNCNPTILEVLWAPIINRNDMGLELTQLRQSFLSSTRVRDSFLGYAANQRKKMLEQPSIGWTPRNWKFAEAYIRTLYQGLILLEDEELPVALDEGFKHSLMRIKRGETSLGEIVDQARELEQELESAVLRTSLPTEPDVAAINTWLLSARERSW